MNTDTKRLKHRVRAGRQITAVVADDSPANLRAVCQTLRAQWDIQIVAAVQNGLDAVRETTLLSPDLVVLDVDMPGVSGPEAAAIICANYQHTSVILMSGSGENNLRKQWRGCGATASLLKSNLLTPFPPTGICSRNEKFTFTSRRRTAAVRRSSPTKTGAGFADAGVKTLARK